MMVDWYFQGKEKGVTAGAARLLQAVIYGAVLVLFVHSATDLLYVPAALFAGNAATAVALLLLFSRREGVPRCRWDPPGWREVLRENAPVGLAVAMGQLVIIYPPVAVGWLVGAAETGLWGAAMKLTFLVLMLDRVLNVALLPPMTRILSQGGPDTESIFTRIYRLVVAGILPVTFLGVVFATPAVELVFGPAYAGSAWMLAGLMGYVVLTLANSVFVCAMIGGGRERQYSGRMAAGSLALVAAVTVLTVLAGTAGTLAGVLAGEAVTLGLMIAGVRTALGIRMNPFQKDLAAGAILLAAAYLVFREPALQALAGIGGYLLVLLLSRSFPAAELRELQRRFL
jgi:O-antigen/teichoic acid export membrane protein